MICSINLSRSLKDIFTPLPVSKMKEIPSESTRKAPDLSFSLEDESIRKENGINVIDLMHKHGSRGRSGP